VAPRAPQIAVCGPGEDARPEDLVAAEAVGTALARGGAVVVCGGLGGVMEAACRGAAGAGGVSVGLLPGDDPGAANAFVTAVVPTGLGELRNGLIVRAADAVVAVGGGFGTLSEIALALKAGLPVFGVDTWRLGVPELVHVESPEDAAARALAACALP
jgi:uncharacterized protein (TIGR00725 family)